MHGEAEGGEVVRRDGVDVWSGRKDKKGGQKENQFSGFKHRERGLTDRGQSCAIVERAIWFDSMDRSRPKSRWD